MKPYRRNFLKASTMAAVAGSILALAQSIPPKHKYEVGAYYFSYWHVDPRNEQIHGKGWTEWRLLERAEPKFPGINSPRYDFPLPHYPNVSMGWDSTPRACQLGRYPVRSRAASLAARVLNLPDAA